MHIRREKALRIEGKIMARPVRMPCPGVFDYITLKENKLNFCISEFAVSRTSRSLMFKIAKDDTLRSKIKKSKDE